MARRQTRNTDVSYGREVAKWIFQRIRGVRIKIVPLRCGKRIRRSAAEVSLERQESSRNENRIRGYRLEENGVADRLSESVLVLCRLRRANPAIPAWLKPLRPDRAGTPAFSVKLRQCDASPPQPFVSNRLAGLYAHDQCLAFLDFSNLAQLNILGETGHERRTEAGASEVAGVESRKEEEKRASQKNGAHGHAERRKA